MMLHLPAYQDLSKEQIEIHNLPFEGTYLVVGPPGSGKTVVALRRTQAISKQSQTPVVLMFNHTLVDYLSGAISSLGIKGNADTQHSWFYRWYSSTFRERVPEERSYVPDWDRILDRLDNSEFDRVEHLLVDEGQDFQAKFYRAMKKVAKNLTVFADENQRLTQHNSTIDDIRKNLRLPSNEIRRLTLNYRNTRPIAAFAAQFYNDLESGIPDMPARTGDKPVLLLNRPTNSVVELIQRAAINNKGKSIGVLLPRVDQVRSYYNRLNSRLAGQVQMYESKAKSTMDFANKQITILAYPSAKGLEFDTVYLPELHTNRTDANADGTRMTYYVLCSLARERLILATESATVPPLMAHVPSALYDRL
jgi:DNA helicase IV